MHRYWTFIPLWSLVHRNCLKTEMFLGSRSAGFLHMDICTQHEMEIKSGNLFVHWPIRQAISFKQMCYIAKVWRNQEPITQNCRFLSVLWLVLEQEAAHMARPPGKVVDGSLARVLPNWTQNHRCAQDAPSLCQRRQCDSELASDLAGEAAPYHTAWDNRQIFLQL